MAEYGITLPLWDYAADADWLDRVAGEVGLDHVTVPTVTGPTASLRLAGLPAGAIASGDAAGPYFTTDGGWHFPPAPRAYAAAGLKPPKARWFGAADQLSRLAEHVARLGLRLVLRLDVRCVPALLAAEPLLAQRSAWGQPVPSAGACVSNSILRELLRCTRDDLKRFNPAAFEIDAWAPDDPTDWTADRPLDWHPLLRSLLDVCFCPSCRQLADRAGVDPDRAARAVRAEFERHAASPPATSQGHGPDPVVSEYVRARTADAATWITRLAEGDAGRAYWLRYGLGAGPDRSQSASLPRILRLPRYLDREPAEARLAALLGEPDVAAAEGWSLGCWRPAFESAAALVRLIGEGTRRGVKLFDFERLPEADAEALTWLKQAVRFARRE